jgi:hypothetical protein
MPPLNHEILGEEFLIQSTHLTRTFYCDEAKLPGGFKIFSPSALDEIDHETRIKITKSLKKL